jgi:hypothetical protein
VVSLGLSLGEGATHNQPMHWADDIVSASRAQFCASLADDRLYVRFLSPTKVRVDLMGKPLDRLSDLLGVDIYGWGQDWELVYTDPDRTEEFCALYEREFLNPVEKSELMRLIVASYDRMLENGDESSAIWERINCLLKRESVLHREIVEYWSLLEEADAENVFPLTPLMREVWHSCHSSEI